jgi:hypothetical protein
MDFESADSTDFGAGLGELVTVLAVYTICDNEFVFKHH